MTTTISFWLMLAHLRMMLRPVAPVDGCRWIEGDYFVERIRRGEEIYCNAPVRRFGESYCAAHWARVYTDPCSRYHGIDRQTTARARRLSICAPSNQPQTAIPVEILHSNEMIMSRLDLIGLPSSFPVLRSAVSIVVRNSRGDHRCVLVGAAVFRVMTSRRRRAIYTRKSSEEGLEQDFKPLPVG